MNKQNFYGYLKTILLTMAFALVLVFILLGVIKHQVFTDLANKEAKEDTIDYYLVNVLIEKNKYLETTNPKNYKIDFRLGILYELKSDFKNAEFEYKQAILKAPYDEYKPKHKLALLYLRLSRFEEAQAVMDKIDDRPSRKLIEYKIDIYNKLGDKYYNRADYETAQEKYEKALFYAKKIKSNQIKSIKSGLASSYVYFAEEKVKDIQIEEAVNYLQMALNVVDAPIIKYKLAVLLIKSNPEQSLKYLDEVFAKEPSIINYQGYYEFLTVLARKAELRGNLAKAELYKFKIKKLKEYSKHNILLVEDLCIVQPREKIKLNHWSQKYNIYLEFKLKNTTNEDINSLFVEIVFKDGNNVIARETKQIVDKKSPIIALSKSKLVHIKTFKNKTKSDQQPKEITAEIYATKKQDAYKILLGTINIKEKVKSKKN